MERAIVFKIIRRYDALTQNMRKETDNMANDSLKDF